MVKSKLDPRDYTSWGVEKYRYTISYNPEAFILAPKVVIDVENYKDGRFAGLGCLIPGYKTLAFWDNLDLAKRSFDNFEGVLIGHVLRTDIHKMEKWGIKIPDIIHYDTALMEHLTNSTRKKYGLKYLVKEKFGIEYPKHEQVVGDGDFDTVPQDVIANYNGMDLVATYELFKSQNHILKETEIYKKLLWPLGFVLNNMEELGLNINLEKLRQYGLLISNLHSQVSIRLRNELGDINFNSSQQKLTALARKGISPKYKGKPSTNKKILENSRGVPLIDDLLQYSELQKLLSSYVTPYLETKTNTIHTFFSQTGTRTGRLSSSKPNVQQVPKHGGYAKDFQSIFEARPGYKLVELDYAAIEPRMLAHFSKSRNLVQLFKSGVNFHDFTQGRMGVDRQVAKVLNLSTGYRATKYGIAYQLKCPIEVAERHLNEWWGLWPDLMLWENSLVSSVKVKGYVETLLGRKIYIDGLDSGDYKVRQTAERRVIENLAQGSVSDLIGLAMIELHKEHYHLVNQIHDSVLLEIEEDLLEPAIQRACDIMQNVLSLEVPLIIEAKVGDNWGSLTKWNLESKIQVNG